MFEPLIESKFSAAYFLSFDIVNADQRRDLAFQGDLLHIVGIIDANGKKYRVQVLDPYEFTHDDTIHSIEEVVEFDMKPQFRYNVLADAIEPLS